MAVSPYNRSLRDQRHEAFGRVRLVFRWTMAGAVAAVVALVGVAAHEIPGRSTSAPSSGATSAAVSPAGSPTSPPAGVSSGGGSLSAPASAPTPTQQAPAAVSGGTGW